MTTSSATKRSLEAAIAAQVQPKYLKTGRGLVLEVPGQPRRRLIDNGGTLTAAGKTYYELLGEEAPKRPFEKSQVPKRVGAQLRIRMADGQEQAVRRWDNVRRRWNFTKLGREFYKESVDRYVVTLPTEEVLVRKNKSTFVVEGSLASTAIPQLGELTVSTLKSEEAQLKEVKDRVQQYLDSLPALDGKKVLLEGGGYKFALLDESKPIRYNKESVHIRPDGSASVSAVLHRPLRQALPWSFGFEGVCPEALEDSQGQCVPKQLRALLGQTWDLGDGALEELFDELQLELYGEAGEPYEGASWRAVGVTAAMVQAFAVRFSLSLHVVWLGCKVLSFIPEKAEGSLCMHVHGEHAFFIADPKTQAAIARMPERAPAAEPFVIPALVRKRPGKKAARFADWKPWPGCDESATTPSPGHYWAHDLQAVRLELHQQRICPKVQLCGLGNIKSLRYGQVVIHRWRKEAKLCEAFAEVFNSRRGSEELQYEGESLAAFCAKAFALQCKRRRKLLSPGVRAQLPSSCQQCGGSWNLEIDHVIPLQAGGADSLENLQVLCGICHAKKTQLENLTTVQDEHPFVSRFSLETYKAFVESPKPPQLVADKVATRARR
jgi:hypothetical protein